MICTFKITNHLYIVISIVLNFMITHPLKSPADIILQQVHFILGKPYSINKGDFMTLWATIRVDQPLYKTQEFVDSSD